MKTPSRPALIHSDDDFTRVWKYLGKTKKLLKESIKNIWTMVGGAISTVLTAPKVAYQNATCTKTNNPIPDMHDPTHINVSETVKLLQKQTQVMFKNGCLQSLLQEDPLKYPHISVAESIAKPYFTDPGTMPENLHAHDYSSADWLKTMRKWVGQTLLFDILKDCSFHVCDIYIQIYIFLYICIYKLLVLIYTMYIYIYYMHDLHCYHIY